MSPADNRSATRAGGGREAEARSRGTAWLTLDGYDDEPAAFWSYVTDYGRRLDSTITFIDGQVQEIRTTPWMEKD